MDEMLLTELANVIANLLRMPLMFTSLIIRRSTKRRCSFPLHTVIHCSFFFTFVKLPQNLWTILSFMDYLMEKDTAVEFFTDIITSNLHPDLGDSHGNTVR